MELKQNNLKYYMEQNGISVADLSHMAKVTTTTVMNYRKATKMKRRLQLEIAELIGVEVGRLFEV